MYDSVVLNMFTKLHNYTWNEHYIVNQLNLNKKLFLKNVHVVAYVRASILFMAKWYSVAWIYCFLFIHSSHWLALGLFPLLGYYE